jgi:hypothetical protein
LDHDQTKAEPPFQKILVPVAEQARRSVVSQNAAQKKSRKFATVINREHILKKPRDRPADSEHTRIFLRSEEPN